ncbi:hypothetical protein ACIRU3_25620 [Streptomyces sp. NPDC101151]|uniref:hypothetical protein n=1 Tax=Streptomyces sp. NPDC101151 TaxID=3366115 RepID=UPI00382C9486
MEPEQIAGLRTSVPQDQASVVAEHVDGAIGVDTHRDTLAVAAISPSAQSGRPPTHPLTPGYQRLPDFARQHVPGRRCWALEGTGSYGAGLACVLEDSARRPLDLLA